jgi:hypothetical protein
MLHLQQKYENHRSLTAFVAGITSNNLILSPWRDTCVDPGNYWGKGGPALGDPAI